MPSTVLISGGGAAAGVVGTATPRFRLFGDTINTAARMSTRAQWGETVVSHAFAQALGLPPRETPWGGAGDVADTVQCRAGIRLVCDGEVPIKGKGMFCVWRLEADGSQGGDEGALLRAGSDKDSDLLFEALVQKQEGLADEGSALARSMIVVASEYEKTDGCCPTIGYRQIEQRLSICSCVVRSLKTCSSASKGRRCCRRSWCTPHLY